MQYGERCAKMDIVQYAYTIRTEGGIVMARRCVVCDKRTETGNIRSHAENKARRTWKPNLQKVRMIVKGAPVRAYVCTRCLKSGKVQRAI